MASLDDLFKDFSRLKEFSENQVVELIESFRQINEKLEEDLPSGIEGYAEFLKTKALEEAAQRSRNLSSHQLVQLCTNNPI